LALVKSSRNFWTDCLLDWLEVGWLFRWLVPSLSGCVSVWLVI